MTRRGRRLAIIGAAGIVLTGSLALAFVSMRSTIVFFRSPSEIAAGGAGPGRVRLGGLVDAGSVRRLPEQVTEFTVGDGAARIPVRFTGIVPDLFREGQGVVTEGVMSPAGIFVADSLLARHDETYMPREVADALKAQGRWQGGGKGTAAP